MPGFFSNFPTILYDENFGSSSVPNYLLITNLMYRLKLRDQIKNYHSTYIKYTIKDGETPEGLAYRYYGDPMEYWVLFFANDIINPFYDWPLSYRDFLEYIKEKYGSIEIAKTTIAYHEMIITTTDSRTGKETVRKYKINEDDPRTNIGEEIPFDNYEDLAETSFVNIKGVFRNGYGMDMKIQKNVVYAYEQEWQENENKREIRVIKKEYLPQIKSELEKFAKKAFRDVRNY